MTKILVIYALDACNTKSMIGLHKHVISSNRTVFTDLVEHLSASAVE